MPQQGCKVDRRQRFASAFVCQTQKQTRMNNCNRIKIGYNVNSAYMHDIYDMFDMYDMDGMFDMYDMDGIFDMYIMYNMYDMHDIYDLIH